MKRFLSILLSALLIVSSIATVTFADATTTMTVDNVSAKAGESVDVYVTLANTPELSSLKYGVTYDKDALTLTTYKWLGNPSDATVKSANKNTGDASAAFDVNNEGYMTCDGKVLQMTFTIAEGADLGKYELTATHTLMVTAESGAETTIDYTYTAGSITVIDEVIEGPAKKDDIVVAPITYGAALETAFTLPATDVITIDGVDYNGVYSVPGGEEILNATENYEAKVVFTITDDGINKDREFPIDGPDNGYYNVTINKKTLTVSGITAADKVYDGNTTATINSEAVALNGVVEKDNGLVEAIVPATGTFASEDAATNIGVTVGVTLDGTAAANYELTPLTGLNATITPAELTVTAHAANMRQNGVIPTFEKTVSGLQGEDTEATVLEGELTVDTDGTVLGDFDITQGTLTLISNNYTLKYVGAKLSVLDKDPVTFTATIEGVVEGKVTYNGQQIADPVIDTNSYSVVDFVPTTTSIVWKNGADVLTGAPTDAGTYTVEVAVSNETHKGVFTATVTIEKATIDMSGVTIENATFGYTDPNKKVTISGLPDNGVSVDKVTYVLDADTKVEVTGDVAATFDKVGTYAVTVSYKITDELAKNHNVPADNTDATLTIDPVAPIDAVITTSVGSKKITITVKSTDNGAETTATIVVKKKADGTTVKTIENALLVNGEYKETVNELENGTEYTIDATVENIKGEKVADQVTATPKAQQTTSTPINPSNKLPSGGLGSITDTNKPSTDEPGTDEPGTDEPGTDEPGTDEPSTDEPEEDIEIVVDPDEEVALIAPEAEIEKDAETGAIVWENTYDDVEADAWYADAVGFAKTTGLMNGVGETAFAPEATLTRGMFATILYRLVDAPEAAQKVGFKDVADDAWYADAVNWGVKNGIVNGVGGASFAPENDVTREQMATMLYRFAQLLGYTAEGAELAFDDAADVADYATEAFAWCTANGIINGVSDTELAPQDTATRAQAAAVFMRALEFFNK